MRIARFSPPLYELNYARNKLLIQQHGMHLIRLLSNQYCLSVKHSANFTFLLNMWHLGQLSRLFRVFIGTEPQQAPPARVLAAEVDKMGLFGPSRAVRLQAQQKSFESKAKLPLKASLLTEVRLLLRIAADERAVFCYENADGCYFLERVQLELQALSRYIQMYATQRGFLRFLEISTLAPAQQHVYELTARFPLLIQHAEIDQLLTGRQVLFFISKDGVCDARPDLQKANQSKDYVSALLQEHQKQRGQPEAKNNAKEDAEDDEEAAFMQFRQPSQFAQLMHSGPLAQSGVHGQAIGPMVDFMVADSLNNSFAEPSVETAPAPSAASKKDPQRAFTVNLPALFSNGLVNSSSINLARKLMVVQQSSAQGPSQQHNPSPSPNPNPNPGQNSNQNPSQSQSTPLVRCEPGQIAQNSGAGSAKSMQSPAVFSSPVAAPAEPGRRSLLWQQINNDCSASRASTSAFQEVSSQFPARSLWSKPQSLARLPSVQSPQLLRQQGLEKQQSAAPQQSLSTEAAGGAKRHENAALVACGGFERLSFADQGLSGAYCYCEALEYLNLKNNRISAAALRIAACIRLSYLNLEDNALEVFSAASFPVLQFLNLAGNPIAKIDLSANPDLKVLILNRTAIAELDLRACCKLVKLSCYRAPLRSLQLSERMKDLKTIDVNNTMLAELILPPLPALEYVYLYGIAGVSKSSVKIRPGVRAFWLGAFE